MKTKKQKVRDVILVVVEKVKAKKAKLTAKVK